MVNSLISILLGIVVLFIMGPQPIHANNNSLRYGTGFIEIIFPDSMNLQNIEVSAVTSSIFDNPFENSIHHFIQDNNKFSCNIPVELGRNIIGIIVDSPAKRHSVGMVELQSDSTLIMTGFFDNGILKYNMSDSLGLNSYTLDESADNISIAIADIIMRFTSYHMGLSDKEPRLTTDEYMSWTKFNEKMDSLYNIQFDYALNGRTFIPEVARWLENNLKYFFDANWRMNYKERAERDFGFEVKDFPIEYYSFLKHIDFSSSFLNHSIYFGPYYLLKNILKEPIFSHPIEEQSIKEWQCNVDANLKIVVPEATPLLLDLLAATSYMIQIKEHNKPLTPRQIDNINNDLDKNLKDIILAKNTELVKQLSHRSSIINLADSSFSLTQFIDSQYSGSPVVVDLWNTWCGPCINAHRETATINSQTDNIVFLYISDTSSSIKEWKLLSERTDGIQLRISEDDMRMLQQFYGFSGFPAYIIFDKQHIPLYRQVGFPGIIQYCKWLDSIK